MSSITPDELKKHSVAAIETALANNSEAFISIGGKHRFVVMSIEQFQYLRECELEAALARTKKDLSEGRFATSSPEEHVARVKSDGEV